MCIDQGVHMLEETEDFTILLQELDHGRVQAGELLEPLVLPWIMH